MVRDASLCKCLFLNTLFLTVPWSIVDSFGDDPNPIRRVALTEEPVKLVLLIIIMTNHYTKIVDEVLESDLNPLEMLSLFDSKIDFLTQ